MKKIWYDAAWESYVYWQAQDRKTLRRINLLIRDIERDNFAGIGKPEPLKYGYTGYWSREIDEKNRLIYRVKDSVLEIIECGTHYGDK
ncbi:MAG: Txe/YoeB family addiction module toxin [Treponemataceae bacterium]|nr:MAG: Txe/YoeB family addiction module toxin [Treponemataceae bacterium]